MISRMSSTSMQNSILSQLTNNQNKYYELQMQALTQKKVNSISDNPVDAAKILGFNDELGRLESYQYNVSVAQSEYSTLDGTLSQIQDKLQRLNELANYASNEYLTAEGLQDVKNELTAIKDTLYKLANTQYDGRYIFAGTNTAYPAFTANEDGSVIYNGTPSDGDYKRKLEVAEGTYLTLNESGDTVFGSYNAATGAGDGIFATIAQFENALDEAMSTDATTQSNAFDTIRTTIISANQSDLENINNIRTKFGTEAQKADLSETSLTDNVTLLKSDLSEIQDIDITEVYSALVNQQYALQASMQVSSMAMQTSLLNYI